MSQLFTKSAHSYRNVSGQTDKSEKNAYEACLRRAILLYKW